MALKAVGMLSALALAAGLAPPALAEDAAAKPPEGSDVIAQQLVVAAQSLGQMCPQKIDDTLTLANVTSQGLTLTYHYKFTDPAVKASDRVAELNKRNLAQSCHHPGMRQMMSVFNVAFVYSYAPSTGEAPIDARIDEKACRDYDQSRWK